MSTSGAAPAGGPPSGAAGGDLGGVYPAPSVVGLQGRGISATAPTDTQGLIWNNGLGLWVPTSIAQPSPSNLVTGPDAFGASPVVGTGSTFSRGDHNHGLPVNPTPAFAAPTIALGTAAAAGAAGTIIRSDATLVAFDVTVPVNQAFGDAAGAGAAAVTARRDHRHGMPAAPVTSLNGGTGALAQTNGYGITGASSNPPAPAVALTTAAATLGANTSIPGANVLTTIMTTAALGVGTWLFQAQLAVEGSISAVINLLTQVGTATATFAGPNAGVCGLDTTIGDAYVACSCIVTVTVAGTLLVRAYNSGASAVNAIASKASGGISGYTALRIG